MITPLMIQESWQITIVPQHLGTMVIGALEIHAREQTE